MDRNKLAEEKIKSLLKRSNAPTSKPTILEPNRDVLKDLFSERKEQRAGIFGITIVLQILSFMFVWHIITKEMNFRALNRGYELLSSDELKTIVTGIFVQILGLLYIIAKSLWDDKPYMHLFAKNRNR